MLGEREDRGAGQDAGHGAGGVAAAIARAGGHDQAAAEQAAHERSRRGHAQVARVRREVLGQQQARGQPGRAAKQHAAKELAARGPRHLTQGIDQPGEQEALRDADAGTDRAEPGRRFTEPLVQAQRVLEQERGGDAEGNAGYRADARGLRIVLGPQKPHTCSHAEPEHAAHGADGHALGRGVGRVAQGGRRKRASANPQHEAAVRATSPPAPGRVRQRGRERARDAAEGHALRAGEHLGREERRDVLYHGDGTEPRERAGQGRGGVLASTLVEDRHGQAAGEQCAHRVPRGAVARFFGAGE